MSDTTQPEVSLICLDTTKFVRLSVFTLIETIFPKVCLKSQLKCAKRKAAMLLSDAHQPEVDFPYYLKVLILIVCSRIWHVYINMILAFVFNFLERWLW